MIRTPPLKGILLGTGRCTLLNGFILNDLATDLERTADHCSNIAQAMLALSDEGFQPHEYTLRLREKQTPAFREAYRSFAERFVL